jgi:hypothetical protein
MFNIVVVDLAQIQVYFANSKKRKMYELSHHFQNTYVAKIALDRIYYGRSHKSNARFVMSLKTKINCIQVAFFVKKC